MNAQTDLSPADVPPDTRQRIIETAARHFAEYGFEAASLRAIQRELGINPASVHYHFGSKRAVYEAIIEAYLTRIQQERQRRFEAIDPALTGADRLAALILAYVEPHLQVVGGDHGESYGRLMARGVLEPHVPGPDLVTVLNPLRERFLVEFARLFPDASRAQVARSLSFAIILMTSAPFDRTYGAMTGRAAWSDGADVWSRSVLAYATAGFGAMCGQPVDHATAV